MSGDLDRARQAAARLAPPPQDWVHARERLSGMLERAATVPGSLDQQALRPWHYVLNGGVLLHLSPYGFDEPMRGRYAYLHDSLAAVRRTMRFPPGGEPEQVPADDRPAEALAAAVLETAPDEDEVAPGDTPADLATFAAGLAAGWPLIGRRDRLWSPGPVPSARFL